MPPEPTNEPERREPEEDSGGDNQMRVAGMIVGTALIFIGFLDIFLSISGGFEIDVIPLLIYFGGVAVWANAVVQNTTLRYSLIGGALLLAAVFFHYGEVLFWHKQVIFWGTVVVVMYFHVQRTKETRVMCHGDADFRHHPHTERRTDNHGHTSAHRFARLR